MLIAVFILFGTGKAFGQTEPKVDREHWESFSKLIEQQKRDDWRNGLSHVISGSIALAGGIYGASIATDTAEKGIYTVFQTIGIASVGYGAYTWQIGGEDRWVYQTLQFTNFTPEQKSQFLRALSVQKKAREKRDRLIRSVTHGLIAALNLYNGSQQQNDSLKNTLFFIGGVNLLAGVSFAIEF